MLTLRHFGNVGGVPPGTRASPGPRCHKPLSVVGSLVAGREPGQRVRIQQAVEEGQLANIAHDAMTHYSEVYSQWRVLYNNFFINK